MIEVYQPNLLVQDIGLEPTRYYYRQILSLLRLPISPILHIWCSCWDSNPHLTTSMLYMHIITITSFFKHMKAVIYARFSSSS